jgi:RNA polymerase sigma factor (sigma-70 family)
METDETLMVAVRNGDVGKLGVLFDRHHRALFDFFVRMTGQRAIADDLVQDVFVRILKYRKTFRDQSWFKAWMFHIARNARFDYYRSHKGEAMLDDSHADSLPSAIPIPGQQLDHEQQALLLECAMFRLSPDKREVLILSRYQDMKYEQIAELIGCEIGTVKTRVHRALKDLRDNFLKLSSEKEKPPCDVKPSANNLRIM